MPAGLPVTDGEIAGILKESIGYPLGVAITAQNMSSGARFSQEIVGRSYQEVYRYFETAIYQRLDLPYRRFLLELSPFESFNLEMARMVSGNAHAGEMLDWLQRNTTMLLYDGVSGSTASGPSSGSFSCGRWTIATRRKSGGPSSTGADCISS